jgi:hypothetical protein
MVWLESKGEKELRGFRPWNSMTGWQIWCDGHGVGHLRLLPCMGWRNSIRIAAT